MNVRYTVTDLIEGRKKSHLLAGTLSLASYPFQMLVALRHIAYEKKWLKCQRAPIPVISVGNISCGGTGKTPFVHMLAAELSLRYRVAILSRGYRSEIEKTDWVVNISKEKLTPQQCGDEPYFLAQSLPSVAVWVGKDRAKSALLAANEGAELLILDDGMQHLRLERDVEIVMIDGEDPFGKGHFLPRGYLRERPERLACADLIVINHVRDSEHFAKVKEQIEPFSSAPAIGMSFRLNEHPELRGKKVGLFCGIGRPERFVDSVKKQQIDIVAMKLLADHEPFDGDRLETFAQECRAEGASCLLCTEKDAVKLPQDRSFSLPIIAMEGQLQLVEGKENWDNLIEEKYERRI